MAGFEPRTSGVARSTSWAKHLPFEYELLKLEIATNEILVKIIIIALDKGSHECYI